MASFMEVSFPIGGLNPGSFPGADMQCHHPASIPSSHWNFLPAQNGYTNSQPHQTTMPPMSRKRTSGQAFACVGHDMIKKSRPEDMPYGHVTPQTAQPSPFAAFMPNPSVNYDQASSFPSSYLEHQNVVHAEKKYQTSLLEALLYEVHGC